MDIITHADPVMRVCDYEVLSLEQGVSRIEVSIAPQLGVIECVGLPCAAGHVPCASPTPYSPCL